MSNTKRENMRGRGDITNDDWKMGKRKEAWLVDWVDLSSSVDGNTSRSKKRKSSCGGGEAAFLGPKASETEAKVENSSSVTPGGVCVFFRFVTSYLLADGSRLRLYRKARIGYVPQQMELTNTMQ